MRNVNYFNYDYDDCSSSKPLTYFGDTETRKWVKCIDNCDICENSNECIYCSEKFFNYNKDSCSSPTPLKYFGDIETRKWVKCIDNCDVCHNNNECLICSSSFLYLHQHLLRLICLLSSLRSVIFCIYQY